ncbi:hypothetical protein [Streptomyces sp. NPDC058953]|uniref:hypothetical protein n=1 Tax=Streptomyces sp. NPDC058953 TaxID=3346676 RepID=UPI003686CF45
MSAHAAASAVHPLAGTAGPMSLFGTRAAQAAGSVRGLRESTRTGTDSVRRLWSAVTDAGPAVNDLRARAEAAPSQVRALGRNATTAAGRLEAVKRSARRSGGSARSLSSAGERVAPLPALVGGAFDIIRPFMNVIAGGLIATAVAMIAINTAAASNPFGGAAIAVFLTIDAIILLVTNFEETKRYAKEAFEAFRKGVEWIGQQVAPVVENAREAARGALDDLKTRVQEPVRSIRKQVSERLTAARDGIRGATDAVTALVRDPWKALQKAVEPLVEWVRDTIPSSLSGVKDATADLLEGAAESVVNTFQSFVGVLSAPAHFVNWFIDEVRNIDFSGFKEAGKKVKDFFLADGGLVHPPHGARGGPVTPLGDVPELRAAEPDRRESGPTGRRRHLETFREDTGAGPHEIAEDLLFLALTA